jgi:predicted DsbA family dithiol-disulfide isomerase
MSAIMPVRIDVISDVACPWCYIGMRRLDDAIALVPGIPVERHWRPFMLEPRLPRGGVSRGDFINLHFGSADFYWAVAQREMKVAAAEGLALHPELIKRQPNTIDCHRLIRWAAEDPSGNKSGCLQLRLMELFLREGGDLTNPDVLVQAVADCGMEAAEMRRRLGTDEDVQLIRALAREALAQGICSIPTYIIADKYELTGAQPSDQFADVIRRISAEINAGMMV